MNTTLHVVVELCLLIGAWFRPQLVDPTLPFGVRVPPDRVDDAAVSSVRRRYRTGIIGAGAVMALLYVLIRPAQPSAFTPVLNVLILMALLVANYLAAHFGLRRIKAAQNWYAGEQQAVAAAVGAPGPADQPNYRWAIPAVLVITATAVIGTVRYPLLPDHIATHFAANGTPDAWSARTWGTALIPVWSQLGLTAVFGLLAWAVSQTRREVNPADPAGSTLRQNRFKGAAFKLLWTLAAVVDLAHLLPALVMWDVLPPLGVVGTMLPAALILASVFGFAWRIGQGGSRVAVPARPPAAKGEVARDDDRFWKGGLFYFNPDDPAFLVQKRFGVGWTLNFGHPAAWATIGLLVAVIVVRRFVMR